MRKEHPSAEDARHVLLCLHEVRLDDTINNGQKFKRQDECFARRTGGEVTWVSSGYTCRRPGPVKSPPSSLAGGAGARRHLRHLAQPEFHRQHWAGSESFDGSPSGRLAEQVSLLGDRARSFPAFGPDACDRITMQLADGRRQRRSCRTYGSPADRLRGVLQGALLRSLQEAPADASSTEGALEPGSNVPEGTPGSGDGAVPFVADSPPAENLLLTIPDGPMRHNKALYDAGYEAVRTTFPLLVFLTQLGIPLRAAANAAPHRRGAPAYERPQRGAGRDRSDATGGGRGERGDVGRRDRHH